RPRPPDPSDPPPRAPPHERRGTGAEPHAGPRVRSPIPPPDRRPHMYVVNIDDLNGTERDIVSDNWRSRRMVLAREGVGFSFHETTLFAGTTSTFHYQN